MCARGLSATPAPATTTWVCRCDRARAADAKVMLAGCVVVLVQRLHYHLQVLPDLWNNSAWLHAYRSERM